MAPEAEPSPSSRRRAVREILVSGFAAGVLIALVEVIEARFLAVESSFGVYGGLVALVFAGLGIWLGDSLRRERTAVVVKEVPAGDDFVRDEEHLAELGLGDTLREVGEKVRDYLAAGAGAVWVVDPGGETGAIHRPGHEPRALSRSETLDGAPVLAGFRLPAARIFDP